HAVSIGEIELHKCETSELLQLGQPRLLERRVVIGAEIVEPHDWLALLQKPASHVESDEPGCTGYQQRTYSRHSSIPSGLLPRSNFDFTSSTTPLPPRSSRCISRQPSVT